MSADWFYRVNGREYGPVESADLVRGVAEGTIGRETEVRRGTRQWVPAWKVQGLFDRAKEQLPPVPIPPKLPAARDGSANGGGGPDFSATEKIRVLDSAADGGFRVEVLAYDSLDGARDQSTAASIYFANQAGMRLKQVRITLRDGEAIAESGALHFMNGRIDLQSRIGGVGGLGKALVHRFLTKEAAIQPRYRGTGQIYLEPSFSHFLIYRLADEEVIADKGMFYCAQGSLSVGAAMQKNISSAFFGGEGWFQTRVSGTGICVFELPVPADEVRRIDLKGDTLKVDGNFALMRTGDIEFSVERSTKSVLGTLTSGEGLLQTFRGTGSVWIAPTQAIYSRLRHSGVASMAAASRRSKTAT